MNFFREIDVFFSRFMPPITRRIFYILVGLHLVFTFLGGYQAIFALRPAAVFPGIIGAYQLVTYGFVHADFGHLFSNVLALFFFGGAVESRLGPKRYLMLLFLAVIAGGIGHTLVYFGQPYPYLVGFSGAVFAIMAGCLIFIPNATVYLNFLFPIKMKYLVIFYLLFEIVFLFGDKTSNVSHLGHVMGAAVGFAFILWPAYKHRLPGGGRIRRQGGGKVVKSKVINMGHPGRSTNADKRYDDPHWRLDQ